MNTYPKELLLIVSQPEFDNALKERGLAKADLARESGVSKSFINAFAAGKKPMTNSTMAKLVKKFKWLYSDSCYKIFYPEDWEQYRIQRKQAEANRKPDLPLDRRLDKTVLMDILTKKGWTLQDLASEAGVTVQTIYNACAGRARPRLSTAQAIANALDVPIEKLFPDPPMCEGTRTVKT